MSSSDDTLHSIHMYGAASYKIPFPVKGQVVERLLEKAGLVQVACDAGHGWMSATIHVVEHPYYAITDAEGRFELRDVPPGQYTLKAWHEGYRVISKDATRDPATGEECIQGYTYAPAIAFEQAVEVRSGEETSATFTLRKVLFDSPEDDRIEPRK